MEFNNPSRLTNQEHIPSFSSFHLYHHFLHNRVPVHWHEFYEFSFVVSGRGTHNLNGNEYALKPGASFLLTPIDIHELIPYPDSPLEIFNVVFTDEFIKQELDDLLIDHLFYDRVDYVTHFSDTLYNKVKDEFQMMITEKKNGLPGYGIVMKGALERILIEFVRARQSERTVFNHSALPRQYEDIFKALVYIHHHFRNHITLTETARYAQFTPNYFSQCFHQVTGKTFQNYLQDLRIQFAKSLLKRSDIPITNICYASGFRTLSHFNRTFKKKTNQSPREYRKNMKKKFQKADHDEAKIDKSSMGDE